MIKKLRTKFILINMTFVTTILIVVVGLLIYSNFNRYRRDSMDMLHRVINTRQENRSPDFRKPIGPAPGNGPEPNASWNPAIHIMPFFTVSLNPDLSIDKVVIREVSVDDTVIKELTSRVMLSEKNHGKLNDYSLRYLKRTSKDSNTWTIAFVDCSFEEAAMRSLILNCLLLFTAAELAFFILSLFLSKWALHPVSQAWEQQNQFVADASHELKTPITVILANLGILAAHKEATVSSQEKWLRNTKDEAERMKQLIEDLLFLAKSDADNTSPVFTQVDFSDVLWSCLLPFESIAFENNVAMNEQIAPDLKLYGNEGQLKQLIVILLDNACKYAGENGKVSIEAGMDGQKHIFVRVSNTGETIQKSDLDHIFERFYRVDKSRVRKAGGYGLGLSIARTIAENHHGTIQVKSSLEDGTIFTVTFPANN